MSAKHPDIPTDINAAVRRAENAVQRELRRARRQLLGKHLRPEAVAEQRRHREERERVTGNVEGRDG